MNQDEYYNRPSRRESATIAAWCFIAVVILIELASMSSAFGGLAP